jgi:hypothetical protein
MIYGMSAYMSFFMKHNAVPFWKRLFSSPSALENQRIYERLEVHEQITVDYLQYLRFKEKLLSSTYDFTKARDTYQDFLGQGSLTGGLIKKLVDLYMFEYPTHSDELEKLQKFVYRPYININYYNETGKEFIQTVLMKFKRPPPVRRPPNNNNNNNNYSSPVVSVFSEPTEERRSFAPTTTRKTFAPRKSVNERSMGAFNRATLEAQKPKSQRVIHLEKQLEQENEILKQYEQMYSELSRRYGKFEALKPKLNFLTRKIKYIQGTGKRLNQQNQTFLEDYRVMKIYKNANIRKQSLLKELVALQFPPLPGSTSTMGDTSTNND